MLREDAQQAGGAVAAQGGSGWRCAACGAEIALDRDRIPLEGQQTRAFVNPDGCWDADGSRPAPTEVWGSRPPSVESEGRALSSIP